MTEPDLKRFGEIVRRRREELGYQQEEMPDHGGPSSTTMSQLERGLGNPSAKTLRKLDAGLSWTLGSAAATLNGGEPIAMSSPKDQTARTRHLTRRQREIEFLRQRTLVESKPENDRTKEEKDWLVRTLDARNRLAHKVQGPPAVSSHLAAMVELSFLADDADAAASLTEPDTDDEDEVENYIWEVNELVSAVEYLTQAVHDAAVEAAGGDVTRLRAIKREVRRSRMGPDIFDLLAESESEAAKAGDAQSNSDRDAVDADVHVSSSETDSSTTELGGRVPRGFLADQVDASTIDESTDVDQPHGADRH